MECTPKWMGKQIGTWLRVRLQALVVVGLVGLVWLGQPLESSLGWVACPPQVAGWAGMEESRKDVGQKRGPRLDVRAGWQQGRRTWVRALAQSELLALVWAASHHRGLCWVPLLPWVAWLLEGVAVAWPWLGRQPEMRGVRWAVGWLRWGSLLLLSGEALGEGLSGRGLEGPGMGRLGSLGWWVGSVAQSQAVCGAEGSGAGVEAQSVVGGCRIRLRGEFYLTVRDEDPFRRRLAVLFLRQLEGPVSRRGSRATRDGRRPLVTQQQLAAWFDVPQPDISRWERYWLEGNWANLLSQHSPEVLTAELRDQIVDVLARFPWWKQEQVYHHLHRQGVPVTHAQVRQAARDSGWARLRQTMKRFFVVSAESLQPRDGALTGELLAQVQTLLTQQERGEGLTPQEQLDLAHLKALCTEVGITPSSSLPAVPWAQKVKWVLFAAEAAVEEGMVRCTYCGSSDVRPKGRKPRLKRYLDEDNQWQTGQVYRYRCRNAECPYGSFTHLPLGLLPYSPYPLHRRLVALQMYAWGRSSYRRTAQALGVRAGRIYHWLSAFGQELLPVAALFGVVRSSGVVGVDEKWVQVPDKAPRGSGRAKTPKPRRWMYVYLAVDVYTYDLLPIALYPHNTAESCQAFLLALRAKGYRPRVIVTDLRKDYGSAIPQVFPQACHHECIFHALQWMHRQLKEVYGRDYAKLYPQAVKLKENINTIFQAKTRRTAEKRYAKVMAWRRDYVAQQPEVATVFDTLERHWPKLVNGIESTTIPRTNNAVELVIRRLDQHYQNFCGFDSLPSARLFLAVFEKVYRFTPFTEDAQPHIRGRCPLELAGYDISRLPMTQVCRGWALAWPSHPDREVVPHV